VFSNGITLGTPGTTGAAYYGKLLTVPWVGTTGGLQVIGADGTTDVIDMMVAGINAHEPVSAPSFKINSGTAMTGSVGAGGYVQETTSAAKTSGGPVAFDATGNTVNATGAGIAGAFCATGTGTNYLGDDGTCHAVPGSGGGGSLTSVSSALSSNVALSTSTSTWNDGPSVTLTAGKWLLTGSVQGSLSMSSAVMGCKLWDGTTVIASGQAYNTTTPSLSLSGIASPSGSATWKISCMINGGTGNMTAILPNYSGAGNTASTLSAVKIQ
jgi:hypothetical protein